MASRDVAWPAGRWRPQKVGTVTGRSALSPGGRHCHQEVDTVTRSLALSLEKPWRCHDGRGDIGIRIGQISWDCPGMS